MARNLTILKKQTGFTLVELLVVIGIVALLSALVTINWRGSQDNLALQRSAVKVSQDIKRAAELSLRGQSFSCATGSITGYGIYFDIASPNSYLIFADCNNDQTYNAGPAGDGVIPNAVAPLESGVIISAVTSSAVSIVFVPPDPTVTIKNGSGAALLSAQITLSLQNNPSSTKVMTVNSKGVVSIQ